MSNLLNDAKRLNGQAERLHNAVGLRPTQTSLVLLSLILAGIKDEEQVAAVEPALRESVIALKGVHNCRAEAIDAEAAIMAMSPVAQAEDARSDTDLRIQELESELAQAVLEERVAGLEERIEALQAAVEGAGKGRGRGRSKSESPPEETPAAG